MSIFSTSTSEVLVLWGDYLPVVCVMHQEDASIVASQQCLYTGPSRHGVRL